MLQIAYALVGASEAGRLMKRREFLTLVGGVSAWPLAAIAQRPGLLTIGLLGSGAAGPMHDQIEVIGQALREAGYTEGQNLAIQSRWAEGQYNRLPALATELVRQQVSAIVAIGGPATLAAKSATATIPIVFFVGIDPVASGLVASINRPEGNTTGVTLLSHELNEKKLELLHELVPAASTIAVLLNPGNPSTEIIKKDLESAAHTLGQQMVVVNASAERDIDSVVASLVQQRVGALVVTDDPFFTSQRDKLTALLAKSSISTIYPWRVFVEAGGLASYGPSFNDAFRQVGVYVGQILGGAKAADLPVMLPSKFLLIINLKTARALGIELPASLLARADEVIE
jgi:putative tryptophan/tyrosine transport system substrate-binding protein